jgi:hypothetical protein
VHGGTLIDLRLPFIRPSALNLLERKAHIWIRPLESQTLPAVTAEMHILAIALGPVVAFFLVPTRARFRLKLLQALLLLLAQPAIRRAGTVAVIVELVLIISFLFLWRGKLL